MLPRVAFAFFLSLVLVPSAVADYATPGTGVTWSMDDLVANSGGVVTGSAGTYSINQSVIVSVADRLVVAPDARLTFLGTTGAVGLDVHGSLDALGAPPAMIVFDSAAPTPGAWRGLTFSNTQAGSTFHLAHCEIAHAKTAIDVVGAPVTVEFCDLHDNLDKVIDFSSAGGEIRNCRLHDNRRMTIMMTLSSSPLIEHCTMENNNIDNTSPYPYVNIGLQGINSPVIRDCVILGSGHQMSGGIGIWNSCDGLIELNRIEGCGYGILCYQAGASPMIRANIILSNNIHPDTLNWGFGIACNGSNAPIVTRNIIRHHWYGVALINGGHPNLGNLGNASPDDDGGNHITDNGLSRTYGLYNNTPLPQTAQGNWWGGPSQQDVEDAIFHQPDNPALGLVDYSQWLTVDAVADPSLGGEAGPGAEDLLVHPSPNPFDGPLRLEATLPQGGTVSVGIFDVTGRLVRSLRPGSLAAGARTVVWDGRSQEGTSVPGGIYYYRFAVGPESRGGTLVKLPGARR